MSNDNERRLQEEIDAWLHALPPRTAPRTLLPRVLAAIQSRAALPWYRKSWQTWPPVWRVASLTMLLSLFGGLCLAGWELPQADAYASTVGQLSEWLSGVGAFCNALAVVVSAGLAAVRQTPCRLHRRRPDLIGAELRAVHRSGRRMDTAGLRAR